MINFSSRRWLWRWFLISLGMGRPTSAFPVRRGGCPRALALVGNPRISQSVVVRNMADEVRETLLKQPQRRPRYAGRYPRNFAEKYKEHNGDRETVSKVLAKGMTPAGR
jgi:hypothetical protein